MKNYFLVAQLILFFISAIVIYRKVKCSRNCGNCKKDVCAKKAELVINPQWVVSFILGVVSYTLGALLLYEPVAWLMLGIGLILLLLTCIFLPFAYRFNYIGIYFLRCYGSDSYVEYDNIDNILIEESGSNDFSWEFGSVLTKEYVITPITNKSKVFFKKERVFETQKTTAMLKKYCPHKFSGTKIKNKRKKR